MQMMYLLNLILVCLQCLRLWTGRTASLPSYLRKRNHSLPAAWQQYKRIFESRVESYLRGTGVSIQEFVALSSSARCVATFRTLSSFCGSAARSAPA